MSSSTQSLSTSWRVLRGLARFQIRTFALHVLLVTLAAYLLPFLPGLIVKEVLDSLTTTHTTPWGWVVLLLGAGLLAATVSALVAPVATRLRLTAETLMRRNMLASVLQRPAVTALPSSPGEALVRFNDDTKMTSSSLDFLADPIGQVLAFGFGITVLVEVSGFLTAAVVAPAIVALLLVNVATPRIKQARQRRQETHGEVSGLLAEALAAVTSIQVATAERRVATRLRQLGDDRRKSALHDLFIDRMLRSLTDNLANVATGELLLLLALSPARIHAFTPGDFALFVSYLGQFAQVGGLIGTMLLLGRQTEVSVERMGTLLDEDATGLAAPHRLQPHPQPTSVVDVPPASFERLEVKGLTFLYPSSGGGIADVDLTVRRGELVVITGKIGAGKTTLLRSLIGLLPMQRGQLTWNGTLVANPRSFLAPPRVAYTAQVPRLFSLELADNVRLGVPASDDELGRYAHRAAFERDVHELEGGWATPVGPRGTKLSGGQIQRAATARMLARQAQLLVLDDLSSALDVETESLLWNRLLTGSDLTCLVVSHRRLALRKADRIVVLDHSTVAAQGSLAELLATCPLMRELWGAGGEEPPAAADAPA